MFRDLESIFTKNFKNTILFYDENKTITLDDFKNDMNDFFNRQNGTGEITDLSKYALITDVQNSFDTLANLLKEV